MATVTASLAQSNATPKILHGGTTTVVCSYGNQGVTLTGSPVVQMIKVPNGATITDGYINFHHNGQHWQARSGVQGLQITGMAAIFLNSATASSVVRFATGLPYRVDLSPEHAQQYVYVMVQAANQILSTTFSLTMCVSYVMD